MGSPSVTLSERELGALETRPAELSHRERNSRQILNGLEHELAELRTDLERLRSRISAAISAAVLLAGALAWLAEYLEH